MLKITIPLTLISFTIFTKWWYVLPVDGTDQMMFGFPFPHLRQGGNSMEFVISVRNLIINLLVYFWFWFVIFFVIHKFLFKIKASKFLTIPLWILTFLILLANTFIFYLDGRFEWKCDYEMEIMETGYHFIWDKIERPDYYKYHPEKKK